MIAEIRQATQLWVITDGNDTDFKQLASSLHACNTARDNWLEGIISSDDYLDILSDNEIDIDEYTESVEKNIELIYG